MFKKLRSTDAVLIFSAVLIAYFIWLIAKTGNVEEQMLDDVPLALDLSAAADLEAEPTRRSVTIEVRYPKSLRRQIHRSAFRLVISDPRVFSQPGVREAQSVTVPLLPSDVQSPSLPQSVQVQKVQPESLTVLVKLRTVPVRIVPDLIGQVPAGYRLEKVLVNPPERLLTGPKERLDSLPRNELSVAELRTGPVPLTDLRESTQTSVAILLPESLSLVDEKGGKRLPRDQSFADVQIIVKEESTSRTLEGVPIQAATVTRNLVARIEPTSATVVVHGPRSRVESLDPRAILLRPRTQPEEKPGFVGKIAIEARMDDTAPPNVSVLSVRPGFVVLRYETLPPDSATSPTLSPK